METARNYLLTSLSPRENGYVETMTGSNASISRMASMGITPGAVVLMIRNHNRGPIIIEVRDTLVALGCSEANKIELRGEGT